MDIGTQINQYRIVEHIGRGGMADVWSARDTRLNRMVAIKTIAHGLSPEVDPISLFKQEAQTIAQMEHPHILPIYDFGEFEGQLYIVMRYVAGGSLEDLLERGPLPVPEALRIGTAIAQALDHAHSNDVVHLDLKPPNILLDSNNTPYLADFGLATALNREGKAMNPGSGTLLYMAPEQLTEELLDKRADIYSFCIMLFHMLTGKLPYDAGSPLAIKQIQYHQMLPDIDTINPGLPPYLNFILQRGTAVDPDDRPVTLMSIVNEIRDTFSETGAYALGSADAFGFEGKAEGDMLNVYTQETAHISDPDILEAVDIFSRARHAWAGGQGRFLLGVTHFLIMNGYYMEAEEHGLELDEPGMQMLLRGALEYDQEIEFWWAQLSDESRRWVCLHAIRSGNTPTRVRALYRLETLPDAERPQIPGLVAQQLQVETHEEARLAALQVLASRANLSAHEATYNIESDLRGRMLTTLTRFRVQTTPTSEWREVVFTPEIDLMLAEIALDYGMPNVARFAARVIARIHSLTALNHIAEQQRRRRPNALRALAIIRDETPDLPGVGSDARVYAWLSNTTRRMFEQPMGLVYRFAAGFLAGWLAMGLNAWLTFRYAENAIFTPDRWRVSLGNGLIFGLFIAFLVLLAGEFMRRLRGFWPPWARLLMSTTLGLGIGTLAWGQYTWFALTYEPDWDVMAFGGAGLALGVVLTAMFNWRSWIAVPLTAFATFSVIYITFENYLTFGETLPFLTDVPLFYFRDEAQVADGRIQLTLLFALLIGIGAHLPRLYREARLLVRRLRGQDIEEPNVIIGTQTIPLPSVPGFETPRAGTQIVPVKAASQSRRPGGLVTQQLPESLDDQAAQESAVEAGANGDTPPPPAAPRREPAATERDINQGRRRGLSDEADPDGASPDGGLSTQIVPPEGDALEMQRVDLPAGGEHEGNGHAGIDFEEDTRSRPSGDVFRRGLTTEVLPDKPAPAPAKPATPDPDATPTVRKKPAAGPATEIDVSQGRQRPRLDDAISDDTSDNDDAGDDD